MSKYCKHCGGGREIIVPNHAGGYTREICDYCKGSGLGDTLILHATLIAHKEKDNVERVAFEVRGIPEEWCEGEGTIVVANGKMYFALTQELTADGQPKDNRLAASQRELVQEIQTQSE